MAETQPRAGDSKPEPDLSGRQLGDYQLMRRLGRGGMADVYLAEQGSLRRQVAFKVLHNRLADDESYVRRFHNEAQAAAALVHANIVQIYEVGCIDGIHFIAQEYVAGQNLRQLLTRKGPLATKLAVNIMRQVAAALHKAGQRGIIHRDIKPENIMLATTGEVKVADFGLARVTAAGAKMGLTQVGVTLGTPLYMSPEQVEGGSLDPRSDLYSLGVTCYQMLAGRPPFEGDTALSVAVQHLKKEPDRLEDLRPDLPGALCRIVHKTLAKQPQDRYQTAAELLRDLRSLHVEGLPDDWAAEIDDWGTSELLALADARTAATQRLQAIMKTESVHLRRGHRAWWVLAGVLLAFLLGCSLAWLARPASLLDVAGKELPKMAKKKTAAEQFQYAMELATKPDRAERALKSVIEYFPPELNAQNEHYSNKAKLHLGYWYYGDDRLDEAMRYFQELAAQESDVQLKALGLIYQANIHARRDEMFLANQKLFLLVQLNDQFDRLTPRQRQDWIERLDDRRLRSDFVGQLRDYQPAGRTGSEEESRRDSGS